MKTAEEKTEESEIKTPPHVTHPYSRHECFEASSRVGIESPTTRSFILTHISPGMMRLCTRITIPTMMVDTCKP